MAIFSWPKYCFPEPLKKAVAILGVFEFYGYISFMLGNYLDAKKANEEALKIKSGQRLCKQGNGLSLGRLGELEKGIEYLRKAIALVR